MVEDPKKLLRKKKSQNGIGISLNRSVSLPKEGVISVEDLEFDEKFELYLFERFNIFIPTTSSCWTERGGELV